MDYMVGLLRAQLINLRGLRIEQFSPKLRLYGTDRAAFMMYLMEACAMLVLWSPYHAAYSYMMRVRTDLVTAAPLQLRIDESRSIIELSVGRQTRRLRRGLLQRPKVAEIGAEPNNSSSSSAPPSGGIRFLAFHHYTSCCVNDWLFIGDLQSVLEASFLYSYLANVETSEGEYCHGTHGAECCLAKALHANGYSQWDVLDLQVGIGSGSNKKKDVTGAVCG